MHAVFELSRRIATAGATFVLLAFASRALADEKQPLPPGCTELLTADEFKKAGGYSENGPVYRPAPPYPSAELRAGIEGEVELQVTIGGDGKVLSVRVVRATRETFAKSAADTVSNWTYKPPRVSGRPVCVVVSLTHKFELK
jgi:TonB family protein